MSLEQQIEFVHATGTHAYNVAAGAIGGSLTVQAHLLHRRIYAAVRQPNDHSGMATFTLTFKLGGVSVGALVQKHHLSSSVVPEARVDFFTLSNHVEDGLDSCRFHRLPNSLLWSPQDITRAGSNIELLPIDVTLNVDSIQLTCSEWSTITTNTDVHWIIFCLSSAHRFS